MQQPRIRTMIGIVAAGAVLVLGACSGGGDGSSQPSSEAKSAGNTSAPASSAGSGTAQSTGDNDHLLQAGKTAVNKVSDSTLISIETEDNEKRWEVQVVTPDGVEHEMNVSADGSETTSGPSKKSEDSDDRAKHRKRVKAAELDYRDAVKAVTKAVPGRITELNIDTDGDTTVWEADVKKSGTKYEVSIDAASGKVLEKEKD